MENSNLCVRHPPLVAHELCKTKLCIRRIPCATHTSLQPAHRQTWNETRKSIIYLFNLHRATTTSTSNTGFKNTLAIASRDNSLPRPVLYMHFMAIASVLLALSCTRILPDLTTPIHLLSSHFLYYVIRGYLLIFLDPLYLNKHLPQLILSFLVWVRLGLTNIVATGRLP